MLREVASCFVRKPLPEKCEQPDPKGKRKGIFSDTPVPSYQRTFKPGNIKDNGPRNQLVKDRLHGFSFLIRTLVGQMLKGRELDYIKATYWNEGKLEFKSEASRRRLKADTLGMIREEILWHAEFWIKDCSVGEFSFESATPLVLDRVKAVDASGVEMLIEAK